jgi:6-pyruvoyltetrahydropterin/6-carboxytetrahydropterin synthase
MVVNLFDLKQVLLEVLEEFDHKHLNLDMPYFKDDVPTSENIARVLWKKLAAQRDIGTLHSLRLYEDEDLLSEVTARAGLDRAGVTRRYSFTAVHEGNRGHTWDLFVTVHGPIDSETGMVTDIVALDRLVSDQILKPFEGQDLRSALGKSTIDGAALAEIIWHRLNSSITRGRLEHVKLVQTRDLAFEHSR